MPDESLETQEPQEPIEPVEPVEGDPPEPEEGSKRWKEVYYDMKQAKRDRDAMESELSTLKGDVHALTDHNKALSEAMDSVEDKFSESNRPDPIEDPEKYETWITDKITRKLKDAAKPEQAPPPSNNKLAHQEDLMSTHFPDYYETVEVAKSAMNSNPTLRQEIMQSPNPARKAYDWAKDKQKVDDENRAKGGLEPGGPGPGPAPVGKLTEQERRVANRLGISEKTYMEQKSKIEKSQEVV